MPKTLSTRWLYRALGALTLVLVVQIGLAHAIGLQGARFAAGAWLSNSHQNLVSEVGAGALAEHRGLARAALSQLDASPETLEDHERLEAMLDDALPETAWWLVSQGPTGHGSVVAAGSYVPSCPDIVDELVREPTRSSSPKIFACEDLAWWIGATTLSSAIDRAIVYAAPIDAILVDRIRSASGAEAVVFVDGTASSTSLRDDRGNPLSAETLGAVWVETEPSKSSLTQRSLELGNFAGYDDTPNDEVVAAGPHAVSWYIDTRALDPASRVQLALLVPTSIMTVGARIALVALVVGALMLLVAAALIVARFGGAFIRPLERLSESARRVSVGDLSMRVEISEGHEMAPFAVIYNSMLDRLRELITNRSRLSRQAGMADIAASVLHNVGNALTGVRTGVELAEESLQRLPVRHARRLAELLEHNRADPGAFFGPGGRGERVPDFVRELATNLEHSHAETQHELRRAATSAEHAAAAVRAQQRHARPVDLVERCLVHEVVDDALNIAGIERSEGIEVCRDYTRVEAWIDRHRLVQIVLNLANNARDAIASTERHRGRIDLVVSLDPGRGVRVRVIDDGIGVRPEDRDRIFSMGHTTKENGHGVGLHGSANLAAEMGGSLRLEIPANGVGATFELTLPLRMPSRSPLEADDRLAPAGTG